MNFEAYMLRGCILKDKSRIEGHNFNDMVIDLIGDNALLIAKYYKYGEIVKDLDVSERQLHSLISQDASGGHQLKDAARDNRFNLFDTKIEVEFGSDSYDFEIKGVGPQAIRLSRNFTYDEIFNAEDSISRLLNEIVMEKYFSFLNNERLIESLRKSWNKSEAEREKRMKEIKKEEAERLRKQEELEAFLNS